MTTTPVAAQRLERTAMQTRRPSVAPPYEFKGGLLTGIRAAWLVLAIAVLILLVPELQATFDRARTACFGANVQCANFQVVPRGARTLHDFGMGLDSYAAYTVVLAVIDIVVCYAVSILLMLRRSGDSMMLVTAFTGVLFCSPGNLPLQGAGGLWATPSSVVAILGAVAASLLLYLFPTGRFAPRWTVALAIGFIVLQFIPDNSVPISPVIPFFFFLVSIIFLQVYHYRKVSSPAQRQQTKLVGLGIASVCLIFIGSVSVYVIDRHVQEHAIALLLTFTATALVPLPLFLSIGLAVLRYRLWDVDVLINRTLVYLVLTVSLALVYLLCVVGLQAVSQAITGKQSELAVAASTLLIALLFNSVRRAVQNLIDRAFFRQKYDMVKVLQAFSVSFRDHTDLDSLQSALMTVLDQTVQPNHASLWLRGVSPPSTVRSTLVNDKSRTP